MRARASRHLIGAGAGLAVAATLLFIGVAAASGPTIVRFGDLKVSIEGGLTPSRLPLDHLAPVTLQVSGSLATTDGSQPPALGEVILDSDRNAIINAAGLPACRKGDLESRDTAGARGACPRAIVGHGTGTVRVAFPEQAPFDASGPLLIFNGGTRGGVITMYFHVYVDVPAPTALVITLKAHRENDGRFGLHSVTTIPVIAGGAGATTSFKFALHREFTYHGRRRGFLEARCVGAHFSALATFKFHDGPALKGLFTRPCQGIG